MTPNLNEIKDFLGSDPGWKAGRVLDVRPLEEFVAGHLRHSVSHPLAEDCPEDLVPSIMLPPRHEPMLLVGNRFQNLASLAQALENRGRKPVTRLVLDSAGLGGLPESWRRTGRSHRHLWQPPSWLKQHRDFLPPPALGPVLDLGCGSGRAAVWLAEKGYRVTGIDWQSEALAMGRQLAASRQVNCHFIEGDLREIGVVPEGPWAVILNFRFLQRELLGQLNSWLLPGGVFLLNTFRDSPGYVGHPQPRHRLKPAELTSFLPGGYFQILAHEESFDPDGRPSAGVVARRKTPL